MRLLPFLLICLSLLLAACGQDSENSEPSQIDEGILPVGAPERPQTLASAVSGGSEVAFWQVSDEDTILYMLGTVPLIPPGTDWQRKEIRAAFGRSGTVFLEADFISREGQRAMGVVVAQTAEIRSDKTLAQLYKGEERERLTKALAAIGASVSDFETFRPWFAAVQSEPLAQVSAGGDPAGQLDILIAREAFAEGKRVRYLETAANMLAIRAAGRDEEDAPYLLALAERLAIGQPYYADVLAAWWEGDTERLDFLLNGPVYEAPAALAQRVIVEQHQSWAQQLDRVLTEEQGIFLLAMGTQHMVGAESLPVHLARRGYEVERF